MVVRRAVHRDAIGKVAAAVVALGMAGSVNEIRAREPGGEEILTRSYEVRDLAFVPMESAGMQKGDRGGEAVFGGSQESKARPEDEMKRLAGAARLLLSDVSESVEAVETRLVVRAAAQGQARVEEMVKRVRARRSVQVSVEARFIELDPKAMGGMPEELRGMVAQAVASPRTPVVMGAGECEKLMGAMSGSPKTSMAMAPKLTLFANQQSKMLVGSFEFYEEKKEGEKPVAGLKPKAVFDGVEMVVRAVPAEDGSSVAMHLEAADSRINRDDGGKLKVDASGRTARDWTWVGEVNVRPGEGALVVLTDEAGGAPMYLVVRAGVVRRNK